MGYFNELNFELDDQKPGSTGGAAARTTTNGGHSTFKTESGKSPVASVVRETSSEANTSPENAASRQRGKDAGRAPRRFDKRQSEYEEKLVDVARVTTVVKGGRRFSFSAVVVIGNKKGKVGYGHGKANEVPDAIKKAVKDAQRNLIEVPIVDNRTIPHETIAKFTATQVLIKPATAGRGIVASGSVRAVVELAGYKDIVTKAIGSSNKTNNVKATLRALQQLSTPDRIAKLRDVDLKQLK